MLGTTAVGILCVSPNTDLRAPVWLLGDACIHYVGLSDKVDDRD
jgi:hypothetical protein